MRQIVEIEREKGLQEVTILDENKEKEVYFNERNDGWEQAGMYRWQIYRKR